MWNAVAALLLHLVMIDDGALAEDDLGDGVGEVGRVRRAGDSSRRASPDCSSPSDDQGAADATTVGRRAEAAAR